MNVFYKAGVTALAVCFNLPVMAQAQPTAQGASQPPSPASLPARDMEHVLVTVPMHRTDAETALPITVLSDSKLRNSLAATIGETLASKPGLASASFGPSVGQPVIRGQQGARVTVLQNSTSSADASNISADHSVSVEPVLAQSIEVLRGPSTLLYGGGAIGGVVNVIDNRVPVTVPKNLSGAFEVRHASVNDEATAVVSVNGGAGNVAFHFDALNRETNDIEIPGRAAHESAETTDGYIENTDSENSAYTFGASRILDKGFIGLAVNRIDSDYGIPPGAHEHEGGAEEEEIVRLDIEQTRYDIRADIHNIPPVIENLRWFFTYSDYAHQELEGAEIGTQWSVDSWENRFELVHTPIANWHGVVGLQIKQSEVAAVGDESFIPKTDVSNYGIFILEDFHRGDWVFELGGRIDRDELTPDSAGDDKSFTSISLSASTLWAIDNQWSLGVALSQSERAPVIEELYSNAGNSFGVYVEHVATSAIEVGSSELDSEQANNIDLTLNYKTDSIDGYLTMFFNNFSDYIYLDNTGLQQDETDILQYAQQDAEFYGVEFELTATLASVLGGDVKLTLFGDRIEGELDTAGDVPRMPPQRLGSRIEFTRGELSTYLSVVDADDQDKPGFNEEVTDGYTRWDAGINYLVDISADQEVLGFIRLKNLSDEEIRNASSFLREIAPEAGRSIEAGLRYSF